MSRQKIKDPRRSKPVSWVVYIDEDGKTQAEVDDFETVKPRIEAAGYKIIGYPSFKQRVDAISWCEQFDYAPRKVKRK